MRTWLRQITILIIACLSITTAQAGYYSRHLDSPWSLGARVVSIDPKDKGSTSLGGDFQLDNSFGPELFGRYRFTEEWRAEFTAFTSNHDVKGRNTTPAVTQVGSVSLITLATSLQYTWQELASLIPYVGVGAEYNFFTSEKSNEVAFLTFEDKFGFLIQGGLDYPLTEDLHLNIDVRKGFFNVHGSTSTPDSVFALSVDPLLLSLGFVYHL